MMTVLRHDFKSEISMPNRQIWVSQNGNNSNSGSASSPLKTIQAALNKASSGTDVMVKAGTYTGNLTIHDDNVSLISADGNHEAIIRPGSQSTSTINAFGREGITIRGFEIDGANNSNAIHFGMSGSGFNDVVRNITIADNRIYSSGQDGVKISQGHNVKILHNDISGTGQEGIDFVAVNGSQISGNQVHGIRGTSGIMVKGGSSDVDVANNKVWDTNVNGISVGGWTDERWMWPNARHYEAKDLTVTGNEVWDVNKSAILVSGARDSHISNNYLHPNNSYDAVIWIDRSTANHPRPIYSENITLTNNTVERSDWLRINAGNSDGLHTSGNRVGGTQHASDTRGAWASADGSSSDGSSADGSSAAVGGDVAGASASAGDREIAVAERVDNHTLTDTDGRAGLLESTGGESIVYTHVREAGTPASGAAQGNTAGPDDHPHFQLPNDTADTTASGAVARWQALEDAPAQHDAVVAADELSHGQNSHHPAHDGWLL